MIVNFRQAKHCWECGLSQRICRRLEREKLEEQVPCEYPEIMLPCIFILFQQKHLQGLVEAVGFRGVYDSEDLQEWLGGIAEGFGQDWESNWMKTWRYICKRFLEMARDRNEAWAL